MRWPVAGSGWAGRMVGLMLVGNLGCSTAQPTSPRAPDDAAAAVFRGEGANPCVEQVRRELTHGRRLGEGCETERARITRALGPEARKRSYGVVEQLEVDPSGIRVVVGRAAGCRAWPLATEERRWLRPHDVIAAGCRLRRYEGPLSIHAVARDGHSAPVLTSNTDADGRLEIPFAVLDAALWAGKPGTSLDAFSVLLLGTQGWAGTVDLQRLRRAWADRSARAVMMGRGSPRLFAVRHPDHAAASMARALALEATLARQEHDYLAVMAGHLQPWDFLRRYPWSPYRRAVSVMRSESQ